MCAIGLGYTLITFTSYDKKGPIYHTNVMLSIGENVVIICSESIKCDTERKNVLGSLQNSNKENHRYIARANVPNVW